MNFNTILGLLPYILQGIDLARSINNQAHSGTKPIELVKNNLPQVFDLFDNVGKTLFPGLPAESQIAAAAVVLDPETTKRIQSAINAKGWTPALVVDGIYGQMTKAAVSAFQKANPPLVVDGWAGPATQAVLFK